MVSSVEIGFDEIQVQNASECGQNPIIFDGVKVPDNLLES